MLGTSDSTKNEFQCESFDCIMYLEVITLRIPQFECNLNEKRTN